MAWFLKEYNERLLKNLNSNSMPRSKKFNCAIVTLLCMGIFCFAVKWLTEMFDASKSSIKSDGALVEPYFFLIPIGWLFLIMGLVFVVVKIVLSFTHRVR